MKARETGSGMIIRTNLLVEPRELFVSNQDVGLRPSSELCTMCGHTWLGGRIMLCSGLVRLRLSYPMA